MENQLIITDPEILSGMPVFKGTRVPVKNLIDYLEAGDSLEDFLDDFPSVTQENIFDIYQGVSIALMVKGEDIDVSESIALLNLS